MGLFSFSAVILPTLNTYLLSLGAKAYFIGIVMSSFSLTGLLSAPIYGRITDKTHSTKILVVISNVFEITGRLRLLQKKSNLHYTCTITLKRVTSGADHHRSLVTAQHISGRRGGEPLETLC